MPNWCRCELDIGGDDFSEIKRFREAAASKDTLLILDFRRFIPYPEIYAMADEAADRWDSQRRRMINDLSSAKWRAYIKKHPKPEDGYNHGGRDWCVMSWGTKWGASDVCVDLDDGGFSLFYVFHTAWSPPIPIIRKMGEMFPKLRFRLEYDESGMAFRGEFEMVDGECVSDMCEDYEHEESQEEP